jgi:hypothetical protein
MSKNPVTVTILALAACPCLVWCLVCQMSLTEALSGSSIGKCQPPPESFEESDLIGIWVSKYADGDTDTLILKEDHTYQQVHDDPQTGAHSESDWQKWWVEYREDGIPYLHLIGMTPYGFSEESDSLWHDFCSGEAVTVQGEVVLLVLGVPGNRAESSPRGVELWHLKPNPDTFSRPFLLKE